VNEQMTDEEWALQVAQYNRNVELAASQLPWAEDHTMPISEVRWVHIDQVQANDWNPNSVAGPEMKLLHTSISEDGYTQPTVTVWDPDAGPDKLGRYVIVDGFHRYTVMKRYPDINAKTRGYLPIVVIAKTPAERMASTVRHNRARGKHSVQGMGSLIFGMLNEGRTDAQICNELGMEAEELARLKHITGYSKLYAEANYSAVTLTKTQLEEKAKYAKAHPGEKVPTF
jgi:hypothetical protein